MKKLAITIAAIALIGTPAFAADMAVKAPPPPPAPVYNWTGWYAGFNFGAGFGTSNNATTTSTSVADGLAQFFPGTTPSGSLAGANSGVAGLNQSGPIGGVQIGYNFQLNQLFVFGFEADIQGAAITGSGDNTGTATESFAGTSSFFKSVTTANSAEAVAASFTNAAITTSGSDLVTADLNWLGTARVRAGYLITPNLLLYATGGLAYGGVSASASDTLNFGNLTADSFALAYSQAIGPTTVATASAIAGPTSSATAGSSTSGAGNATATAATVTVSSTSSVASASAVAIGSTTSTSTATFTTTTNAAAAANAFTPTQSAVSYTQATKNLSVALATTAQSFARVSDTKFGGTVGGGFEWMMAPNWSVKAEALYYDLGSVTVSAPLTASINPITAAISQSPITAPSAINKFVGPTTVSNAAATRVTFQGVIIRLGLNYHFNLL
jgi:opacity protein-like surface antigen